MGLTGKLWPAHIKPKPDELLSSWLVRLSMSHSMKLHTFCSLAWSREKQIWNRDIDKCADHDVLSVIAAKTGTSNTRTLETTLAAYQGRLFEKHNPRGNTVWIMPVGIYHRTRRLYGLQFCPQCLSGDKKPYYRRSWRVAFITLCEQHRAVLHDRCPKCLHPVNFHRNEMGIRDKWAADSITLCHSCQHDLRTAPIVRVDAASHVLAFQRRLTKALECGSISIPNHGVVHSHLYFVVLHQLMRIFAPGRPRTTLREIASRNYSIDLAQASPTDEASVGRDIERLPVQERMSLVQVTAHLLNDWPHEFIGFCRGQRIWSATLLRDLEHPPFWYWKVVHDHLYRVSYTPSDMEIHSATTYLRKARMAISKKAISRTLGKGDVFRKRKSRTKLSRRLKLPPHVRRRISAQEI